MKGRQQVGGVRLGEVPGDCGTRLSYLLIGRCGGRVVILCVSVWAGEEQLYYCGYILLHGVNTEQLHRLIKVNHIYPSITYSIIYHLSFSTECVCA